MQCEQCRGENNLIDWSLMIHKDGCPLKGSKYDRKEKEEKVQKGREYAHKKIFLPDPSERLGKELEEEDWLKRQYR